MHPMTKSCSVCLLLLFGVGAQCAAQNRVQVAVIDGHNGKPITGARIVTVQVLRNFEIREVTAKLTSGKYVVQLDSSDTMVLASLTKSELSWNEYRLCASEQEQKPIYSVVTIISKGLIAPNTCNKKITASPSPGEIVFFVTRLPFWQRLNLFRD